MHFVCFVYKRGAEKIRFRLPFPDSNSLEISNLNGGIALFFYERCIFDAPLSKQIPRISMEK
jgi:hypothetical protein